MDIAGLDILAHVAKNLNVELPPLVGAMVERGWLGEKAGQGFYKRDPSTGSGQGGGRTEILTLDPKTMTYRAKQPARLPALDAARPTEDARARLKTPFAGEDKRGRLLRDTIAPAPRHQAKLAHENT